jgi:hypothetical protein
MWRPDTGHSATVLFASVRALSAHDAGCTQEARYTAADMSVLWGGGTPAGRCDTGVPAIPWTEDRTVGAAVTQMRNRNCQAISPVTLIPHGGRTETREASGWQGSHKAAWRGRSHAQRDGRDATRIRRQGFARSAIAGGTVAGWTVGLHALPMQRADRMESLKDRKAGDPRRG